MKNPIKKGFEWSSLYEWYDQKCHGFNPDNTSLHAIEPKPQNDRELYYALIERVRSELSTIGHLRLGTYEAILYWKLYSQPAAVHNVCSKIRHDAELQKQIECGLERLATVIPLQISRKAQSVCELFKTIDKICSEMHGLKNRCAIPARSTFLHFHFPDVIPIFDKQVLRAVGIEEKRANQSYRILYNYIPFAWEIAENSKFVPQEGWAETSLRLFDMALWVERGKKE